MTKKDFPGYYKINRCLNQNYNTTQDYCIARKRITHGEELKLNREEEKKSNRR